MVYILLICQVVAICFSIRTFIKLKVKLTPRLVFSNFFIIVMILPIFEEVVFRLIYKHYFSSLTYSHILNGIIFGLYHFINYFSGFDSLNLAVSVITNSYFGYYLYSLDTFSESVGIHMLYNFIILLSTTIIYHFYFYKPHRYESLSFIFSVPVKSMEDGDIPYKVPRPVYKNWLEPSQVREDIVKSTILFEEKKKLLEEKLLEDKRKLLEDKRNSGAWIRRKKHI